MSDDEQDIGYWERNAMGDERYFCPCHPIEGGWSLASAYAALQTGEMRQLTAAEESLWLQQLVDDADKALEAGEHESDEAAK